MRVERWRKQRAIIRGDWRVALIGGGFSGVLFVLAILCTTHVIPFQFRLNPLQRADGNWYVTENYPCSCGEVEYNTRIVTIDGDLPRNVQHIANAQRIVFQRATNGTFYEGVRPTALDASVGDLAHVLYIISALIFIGVSMLVYLLARQRAIACAFFVGCLCISNLLFTSIGVHTGLASTIFIVYSALMYLGGSAFLHFFVLFPTDIVLRLPLVGWRINLRYAVYFSYGTAVLGFATMLYTFFNPGDTTLTESQRVRSDLLYLHLTLNIGSALLVIIAKFLAARTPRAKRESRCVAITLGLSFTYFFVNLLVNILLVRFLPIGEIRSFGGGYVALMLAVFPLGMAYAILQYQSFGIRNLLRRNIVYGAAAALLFAGYGLVFFPLQNATDDTGLRLGLMALFCVGVAVSFAPLQQRLQQLADTYIFKDFYDYNRTVHSLTARLADSVEVDELAQVVTTSLAHLLNLEGAAFALRHADTGTTLHRSIVPTCPVKCTAAQPLAAFLSAAHLPEPHRAYLLWPQPDDSPFVALALAVSPHITGLLVLAPRHNDEMFTARDINLIETLGRALAVSLHKALLVADLHDKISNLERTTAELEALTQQVLSVSEGERVRLAREIHDDPLQQLMLVLRQFDADDPTITARERYCWRMAQDVSAALRSICTSLRPPILTDLGLSAALDSLVTRQRRQTQHVITLHVDLDTRLEPNVETALYRVAQEGLQNALNHAQSNSIHLTLLCEGQAISLRIEDDGRGVTLPLDSPTLIRRGHLGLVGMRERMHAIGGELHLRSAAGQGTCLEARLTQDLVMAQNLTPLPS